MAKKIKRISGNRIKKADKYLMPYLTKEDECYDIDINDIGDKIKAYQQEAKESGKYSHSGLCRKLGITHEILDSWRKGYVNASDELDINIMPNEALAHCIAMGELAIYQYWEECDKPSVQAKHVKMLEKAGILGGTDKVKKKAAPPFDLGSLSKYSK